MLFNILISAFAILLFAKEFIVIGDDFVIAATFLLVVVSLQDFLSDVYEEQVADANRDLLYLVNRALADCINLCNRMDALFKKIPLLPDEIFNYFVSLHRAYRGGIANQIRHTQLAQQNEQEAYALLALVEYVNMLKEVYYD